jgi:hypothetical protein
MNFFNENQKLREIIRAQKIMIGKMELDISSKNTTIGYLTQELTKMMGESSSASSENDMVLV